MNFPCIKKFFIVLDFFSFPVPLISHKFVVILFIEVSCIDIHCVQKKMEQNLHVKNSKLKTLWQINHSIPDGNLIGHLKEISPQIPRNTGWQKNYSQKKIVLCRVTRRVICAIEILKL